METIEYKSSHGIVREWLLAKYSVIHNNQYTGMCLMKSGRKVELLCEYCFPGGSLIFDDRRYSAMKSAGYFTDAMSRHMGEGSVEITNKAIQELLEDQRRIRLEEDALRTLGYKLFMPDNEITNRLKDEYSAHLSGRVQWHSMSTAYDLHLIPADQSKNIRVGTLLVSSVDFSEVEYDGEMDLDIVDGFSTYGIRPMPSCVDARLLRIAAAEQI